MMFVFASIGDASQPKGWPVHLMHQTEAAFIGVTLICFLIAVLLKPIPAPLKVLVALIGGASAGFGSLMPFELAPFFFGSRGEVMMASIALILVYPFSIGLFIFLFMKLMAASNSTGREV